MPRSKKKPSATPPTGGSPKRARAARLTGLRSPQRDPSLVEVEIDGEPVGSVLRGSLDELRLVEGAPIGVAARKRIDAAIERARARGVALRMLARSDRSAAFIEQTLVERHGISADVARATSADLAADGWQDDRRFAELRSQRLFAERKASRALVVATLVEEGVEERLAERTAARVARESDIRDDLSRAIACAREARPAKGAKTAPSVREWRRIAAHLARRGYDEDTVATALERVGMREA